LQLDLEDHVSSDASIIADHLLQSGRWKSALAIWAHHSLGKNNAESSGMSTAFRVATLRSGKHPFTSRELDAALGAAVAKLQPEWHVSLDAPHLLFIGLLAHRRFTFGLLLPPFEPRRTDVLPLEPRAWLCAGRSRPHTRPSRAALLVRLANLKHNERLLDPCGGIGILSIEAATFAAVHAISCDTDAAACAAARENSRAASLAHALRGTVSVFQADGLRTPLPTSSIDVAIADIPFGQRHSKLDINALMRELARLIPTGGRALIFGNAGPGGSATACLKATRVHSPGAWRLVEETPCYAGGISCTAMRFERLEGPGKKTHGEQRNLKRILED
jgi:cytochrome-b5 reductase